MRLLLTMLWLCCAAPLWAQRLTAPQAEATVAAHMAAARDAQAHTNCRLAAQEYHAAARLMPGSGEIRTNEAIALYCDGQLASAVMAFQAALHLNASLAIPHLFLGIAAYRTGDLAGARKELTVYLTNTPDDPTAHLWLGYTLDAAGNSEEAVAEFKLVLARKPDDLDAEYALGEAALTVAHNKAAQVQKLDPSGAAMLQLAATRFARTGDNERAQAASTEAAKRSAEAPTQPAAKVQEQETLLHEVEIAEVEAQAALGAILKAAPDSYRAHEVMGDALMESQQQTLAIEQYQEVIRLNPTLPGVHEMLSQCLMTAGRFQEALDALTAERALSPVFSSRLLTRTGQVQLAMGDEAAAAHSLRTAVADPHAPAQAYLLLGQVLLRQQHAAEAVPALRHYLSLEPAVATAYYSLSRAYRALGDRPAMAQALEDFRQASQKTVSVTPGSAASSFTTDTAEARPEEIGSHPQGPVDPARH